MKIYIVVPVYNDNHYVKSTIEKILSCSKRNVIIVNDGSTDGTSKTLKQFFEKNRRIMIVNHEFNYGKGMAMRNGIEKAWSLGAEAVVFMDIDGQHDPKMLPVFESEIQKHLLVFGYRDIDKNMPRLRRVFNRLVQICVRVLFGMKKRDLFCGYLAIRKKVYKRIRWTSNRYGIETEMGTKVGRKRIPFKEIKVDTIYLGKKHGINWLDGIKILLKIPVWYYSK